MRVFINAILVHTFLNVYVFWRGWEVLPRKLAYRVPFITLFVIELLIYLTGFVYVDELNIDYLYPIMILGTSWMIFILYMTMLLIGFDLLYFLGRWIKRIREFDLKSIFKKRIFYAASVVLVALLMVYGSYRFHHPVVNELNLTINKKSDIKALRVVMVADIHVGYMINRDILKMYVDKINEQHPDIILLVGDIIDYDMIPLERQHMEQEFRRLKAPYGVYGVTGNHEYRVNSEEKIRWLKEEAGIIMLRDSVVKVDDAFYIIGREDNKALVRKEITELMPLVDKNYPIIVMNHEPHRLHEESESGADLAVYGHTHNGQLFPNNLFVSILYEVSHGYKKKNNTHIYVTSGLGLSGPQYRIGTISEIVVLNLKFENQ